jgi:adenylate cyclase
VATGLSDDLRSQLSRVPALRVISRDSSTAVENRSLTATRAAELLRVATLVEGTVRRDRRRLRVSVQLVDGRDGAVLWSQHFDRDANDLLQVQTEIAKAVVGAVMPAFISRGGQIPATATSVVSAQDLFAMGRELERKAKETPEAYRTIRWPRRISRPSSSRRTGRTFSWRTPCAGADASSPR